MRSLTSLITENMPASKPELWRGVGHNLRRRTAAWLNGQLDREWWHRPFITTIQPGNLLLEVVPGDVVGKPIVYYGVYEYAVSSLFRELLCPGDVFVDIGANIGYYTVLAGSLVGATGLVVAFEPSARIRSRLQRNVALNQFTQVRVREQAVTRESGVVRLVEPSSGSNDGLAYVDLSGSQGHEVSGIPLDQVEELSHRAPTLLKVDVEGGESEVFAGAERLLREPEAPAILFESFDLKRDALLLERFGYRIYQPLLVNGLIRVTPDLEAAPYRRWEAPNFLAVKGTRGRELVARLHA